MQVASKRSTVFCRTFAKCFSVSWFIVVMMLLGISRASAQPQIAPFFSVRPETLSAAQASRVLLTVRTTSTGPLTPAGAGPADQFTFIIDAVGSQVQVSSVDASVILHVSAFSLLTPSDFQVTVPAFNQVSIKYVGATSKTFGAGETISVHATLTPMITTVFGANVGYASALHTLTPSAGDTIAFVDFPVGPPGPQGPPGLPGGNVLNFNWSSVTGQTYQLQYNTNLLTTNWNNLGASKTATNVTMSATDHIGPDPQRFYRVKKLP